MLTSKQKELLIFIHARIQETGVPPSFDEMKAALELRSKSGIHRLITALEERGFIRRLPHRARALEIIKLPDAMQSEAQRKRTGLSVIEGGAPAKATAAAARGGRSVGDGAADGSHCGRRADQRHPEPSIRH